jgi:hypothetical protein
VIVAVNVNDDVPGWSARFFTLHPNIHLINRIPADPEIADGLTQVGREPFLPGLAVADLVAIRETVAVCIDAARPVGKQRHMACARCFVGVFAIGPVNTVSELTGVGQSADIWIVFL